MLRRRRPASSSKGPTAPRWRPAATTFSSGPSPSRSNSAPCWKNAAAPSAELDALAADSRLAAKHLDLAVLEKRIEDALHRWQVLAATCSVLDSIRAAYEKDRQPETLQEASGYLDRLTQGRYRRVWTPLGEHVLRVDDAEGRPLPVEALSRGTREQLFLSLRLALASSYARRGRPCRWCWTTCW